MPLVDEFYNGSINYYVNTASKVPVMQQPDMQSSSKPGGQ